MERQQCEETFQLCRAVGSSTAACSTAWQVHSMHALSPKVLLSLGKTAVAANC